MGRRPIILWFRRDFRIGDNPALAAAVEAGRPVLPLYIDDSGRALGGASRWWLHHGLVALRDRLDALGAPLVLRRGKSAAVLAALVRETGASAVYWNALCDPSLGAIEEAVRAALTELGVEARIFGGAALLHEPPQSIRTASGRPFQAFAGFWRACAAHAPPAPPLPRPAAIPGLRSPPSGDRIEAWGLLPGKPDWTAGLRATWRPGERQAAARLAHFLAHAIDDYGTGRDIPGIDGTSRLSPHLHFGELSVRQVWHAMGAADSAGAGAFRRELGWREFSHHLLAHAPHLAERPLRPAFERFPWREDPAALAAWQHGRTGYPIVDAGMRQLWRTGWLHNRVRMLVASFLVKHLLLPWQQGEAWFWDTLVDADAANNAANWQWVAGCGTDAAPYFRIFNPVLQGQRFDRDGRYVRRWVPELARLSDRFIHAPWLASDGERAAAGIRLGETYPQPIVELAAARKRALAAFASLRDQPSNRSRA